MKNLLLAGVAGVALVAGAPAGAADLGTQPYKAPPVWAPVLLFTWSGCYIGGHVGGGWGRKDFSDTGDGAFVGDGKAPQSIRVDTSGFLGGGQIGCDYQFSGSWVIGIQGMFDGADVNGDILDSLNPDFDLRNRVDWFATLTGRLGYALIPTGLLYVKGGVAWVHDRDLVLDFGVPFESADSNRTGWTAGVGFEYMFLPNWSAFVEYDYMGFGTKTIPFTAAGGGFSESWEIRQNVQAVLVGLNFRFNFGKAPAAVVAKY
jgi:outer membrane immunogenic protein